MQAHRDKLLEADLLVLVGISGAEGVHDLSHLVARQGVAGLSEKVLELVIADIAAVVDVLMGNTKDCRNHLLMEQLQGLLFAGKHKG